MFLDSTVFGEAFSPNEIAVIYLPRPPHYLKNISASARGSGIGRALLRTSAKIGASKWKSEFVKLTVYADNTDAAQFYDRLGFSRAKRDRTCLLSGVELASLIGDAN